MHRFDKNYTREQLSEAFDKVKRPGDWKAEIHARCHEDDRDVTDAAIIYFTGTVPTFTRVGYSPFYLVEADGYRIGPCGDH